MSCGHAVTPESLTAWCRSLLDQVLFSGVSDPLNKPRLTFVPNHWNRDFFVCFSLKLNTKAVQTFDVFN